MIVSVARRIPQRRRPVWMVAVLLFVILGASTWPTGAAALTAADTTPPTMSSPFLVGTGVAPPSGVVTFIVSAADDVALGKLWIGLAPEPPTDDSFLLLDLAAYGAGPVRLAAGLNVTNLQYGGSTVPGTKVVAVHVHDQANNESSHPTFQVSYSGVTPRFPDVPSGDPAYEAISELAARGVIRGYQDGRFGPGDSSLRAQMAALIARGMGWDAEDWGNPFLDRGPVDNDLWRNVGTLAHYNVARGYPDGTYNPTGAVLNVQVIAFITRAMVGIGYWRAQPDNPGLYPNIPASSGHRVDLTTYQHYLGAVPGTSPMSSWSSWDQPATRAFFAQAEWQAIRWREDPANWGAIPRP